MKNTVPNKIENQIAVLKRIGYITGIASLLIILILILNFLQLKTSDPLELKSLQNLLEQYDQNPQDEALKEEIRSLDLLARKVYFTKEWQLETGGILLLVFLAISLICLRMIQSLKFKLTLPDGAKKDGEWLIKKQLRNSMAYIGIFLVGLIAVVYYFSNREFNKYLSENLVTLNDSTQNLSTQNEVSEPDVKESQEILIAEESSEQESLDSNLTDQEIANIIKEDTEAEPKPTQTPAKIDKFMKNHIAFRGYRGQGKSYSKNIPIDWDGVSGKNIKWKTEVPRKGFSSPIIWENQLFLTGGDQVAREVYAFNRFTGKILWTALVDNIQGSPETPPKTTDDTGLAAPTMTTDGTYVFAIFATGDIICLDMKGKRIWAKNLGVPNNHYGHSSSLISYKNFLYVQYDDKSSGKLIALDTKTGNEKFRTLRKSSVSWTSPILIERNSKIEVVIDSDPGVAGYDATTGKEIWQVDCLYGEIGASPVYNGKYIFASNECAKLVAIEPGHNAKVVWEGYDFLPEVSSPVVNDRFVLTATSYGGIGCFDANTGTELWSQEFGNGFYASPMIAEDRIYLTDMKGVTYIIKDSSTFELIAKPALGEDVVCTPAFADGYIYIRGNKNLYCISEE